MVLEVPAPVLRELILAARLGRPIDPELAERVFEIVEEVVAAAHEADDHYGNDRPTELGEVPALIRELVRDHTNALELADERQEEGEKAVEEAHEQADRERERLIEKLRAAEERADQVEKELGELRDRQTIPTRRARRRTVRKEGS